MISVAPHVPLIRRYQDWLRATRGITFDDYDALWRWSVTDLDGFWRSVWDYADVRSPDRPGTVLAERRMPGAVWFPGTRVNYAREVLRHVDAAHAAGVPLLVDSTLTSPWLIKPFDHGADLVYHSATKFLSGHGTVIGGVVVDGGSFDWERSGRFAELTQAYDGFHGMVFSEESTVGAFLLRARREGLRDFGASMSPHTAWLILQGIETLPLRMERHIDNTQKVVEFLAEHPFVARVGHPLMPAHPSHALAGKLLRHGARGAGAVFSFDLKGSRAQGKAFVEGLRLFSHLANIGDVRSLVIHPASTTHSQLTPEEQVTTGVTPGLVRLAVGLEGIEDILADLDAGFRAAKAA